MRKLKYFVIHCTATPEGRHVSADDIRDWHTSPPPQGRGWRQVGYSDMVHLNGAKLSLVPNDDDAFVEGWEITNGAKGFNSICRHIVYVGGCDADMKPKDTRTLEQKRTLEKEVKRMIKLHPTIKVCGHNQLDPGKACPSFDVPKWLIKIGIEKKNIYA